MSTDDLDALSPLPHVLNLLRILRTEPENAAALAQESSKIKTMFRQARASVAALEQSDVSLEQQIEVIRILEERIERKRRMLQSVDGKEDKVEDVVMAE